jgi:hypothetical protein
MSTTIYGDSYAPYGEIVTGPPARPEPPRQDPAADQMLLAELAKRLNTPGDRIDYWTRWGLPSVAGRISTGAYNSVPFWSRRKVERWIGELRELGEAVAKIR